MEKITAVELAYRHDGAPCNTRIEDAVSFDDDEAGCNRPSAVGTS
tara:strand:+ start:708 stop:842 length:135 start_codon:yes stop_codon:yes gene_type:complete